MIKKQIPFNDNHYFLCWRNTFASALSSWANLPINSNSQPTDMSQATRSKWMLATNDLMGPPEKVNDQTSPVTNTSGEICKVINILAHKEFSQI